MAFRWAHSKRTFIPMQNLLRRFDERLASRADLAPAILRIGLGLVFLAHVYAKFALFTIPGTIAYFESHGLPGWTVYPVVVVELVGGASLVLGYRTRLAALALIPVMLGALVPHLNNGWMFVNEGGGWEYVAFLLVALTAQLILGGGAYALSEGTVSERVEAKAACSAEA